LQTVLFIYLKHTSFLKQHLILILAQWKEIIVFDLRIILINFKISCIYLAINILNIEKLIMTMANLTSRTASKESTK